jgi:hypothetical protein
MSLLADAQEFQGVLADVTTVAQSDVVAVWRTASGLPAVEATAFMVDATPLIVGEYATVSSGLAADFYNGLDPESSFTAVPGDPPPVEQVQASTRWAMGPLFTEVQVSPVVLLSGAVQRIIANTARHTIFDAVQSEGARWARYASATACPFCRMLATRGAVYTSKDAAAGRKYHDNCRCLPVPLRGGQSFEPPSYVGKWQQQYAEARDGASGDTKTILNNWRKAI